MSARQLLTAEVSRFLFDKLENGIVNQLAGNKDRKQRTPLDNHKIAILTDVIKKAKEIDAKYSLALMPDDTTTLKNNVVYVELVGGELHYILRNVIGEAGAAEEYEGVITTTEMPELAFISVPLDSKDLKNPCIDVLTLLFFRKHLKFSNDDSGIKQKDDVLKAVLKNRDDEFVTWLYRFDSEGRAPADLYVIQKRHFISEYERIEKKREGEDREDFEAKAEKHFAKELAETVKLHGLYRAVFEIHYRLSRQMFCLQQYSSIMIPSAADPEDYIVTAKSMLAGLKKYEQQINGLDANGLKAEFDIFQAAFTNLIRHIRKSPEAKPFQLQAGKGRVATLVAVFDGQVNNLQRFNNELDVLRVKAQAAAKSGDQASLHQHLKDARARIVAINAVRDILDGEITNYTRIFHDQIANFNKAKSLLDGKIKSILKQIPDMLYLIGIATLMESKVESENEFTRLNSSIKVESENEFTRLKLSIIELVNVCGQWGTLASEMEMSASTITVDLERNVDIYYAYKDDVTALVGHQGEIKIWQASAAFISNDIPMEIVSNKSTWNSMPKTIAEHWLKPHEEWMRNTKANDLLAFMRRHWWKMVIGAVVLTAATIPVAIFLGISLAFVALASAVAIVVGVAAGAGVGHAADQCCSVSDVNDNKNTIELPQLGSSAKVISASTIDEDTGAGVGLNLPGAESESDESEPEDVVIDFAAVDASLAALGSRPVSNNPFDKVPDEIRGAGQSPRSTNPFAQM